MIRSSRIPPLLDRICTDGIVSSLLISKDGELLGSSTNKETAVSPPSPPLSASPSPAAPVMTDNVDTTDSNEFPLPWTKMNPSDVGAIIAEVVQDYQRLGCELALLDPPSSGIGIDVGIGNVTTSNATSNEGNGSGGDRDGSNGTTNITSNSSSKQQQEKQQMSSSETSNVGNDANKIKDANGSHRERGRLNCLIMEFDLVRNRSY